MECLVFLFPEKSSLPMAYCCSFLGGGKVLSAKAKMDLIDVFLSVHKSLCKVSYNYRGYYIHDNLGAFLSEFSDSGYPKVRTLLRQRFKSSSIAMSSGFLKESTTPNNLVFSVPSVPQDYFVEIASHSTSTSDSIACIVPSWIGNRTVPVICGKNKVDVALLEADCKKIWAWVSSNHSPKRIYEKNPKHSYAHLGRRGVPISEWSYNDSDSQVLLDKAIPHGDNLIYHNGATYLVFHIHDQRTNTYHAYPDEQFAVNKDVKRLLKDLGIIT